MKDILFLSFLLFTSTIFSQTDRDLKTLLDWMPGSYSSEEQSRNDSDYFNISLEMVLIWRDRTDGPWLYVEQSLSDQKDKPYRQRVYHLVPETESISSIIYTIPNEKDFIGAYKNSALFDKLTPDSIEVKDGCEVIIKRITEDIFSGATKDKNCSSNLRGASYATSEVLISKDKMISWDRGFNADLKQVWGPEKGGYVFIKK